MSEKVFSFLSYDDILNLEDPEWLIEDVLPKEALVQIYGPPGEGKTFVAFDMALRIAGGIPWFGNREVRMGRVVYVIGEGLKGFKKRLKAWVITHNPTTEQIVNIRHNLIAIGEPVNLGMSDDVEALGRGMEDVFDDPAVSMFVFDTLARCIAGLDENSAAEMGAVVDVMDTIKRETGATVMMLHHSPHGQKGRGRGSSAVPGALEAEIGVGYVRKTKTVTLTCTKQKDWDWFDPIELLLVPVDLPDADGKKDGSAVLAEITEETRLKIQEKLLTVNQTKCLDFLRTKPEGVTYKDWIGALELAESSFNHAKNKLVECGLAKALGPLYLAVTPKAPIDHNPAYSNTPTPLKGLERWSKEGGAMRLVQE